MRLSGRDAIGSVADYGPREEVMDEVAVPLAKGAGVGGSLVVVRKQSGGDA
jgi:hypothetical protein